MVSIKEVSNYIKAGKKIQAVKLVRESTGVSLRDAKKYVDELELLIEKGASNQNYTLYEDCVSAIDGMDGHEFEYFCADLLREIGFSDVSVTPGSGDQGVDILAQKEGIKYAIQCKNYASTLSNTPVQEVSAGKQFYGCHVGVVMTNSTFTPGAIQLAAATNVLLWDREKLDEFISQAGGLETFGIFETYSELDDEGSCEDVYSEESGDKVSPTFEDRKVDINREYMGNNKKSSSLVCKRRGMRIWSRICFGWTLIGLLMIIVTTAFGDGPEDLEYIGMFLGEGLFTLILGFMFVVLSKSEKRNPYIKVCGKTIKKAVFVIICIILAYVAFLTTTAATGTLKIN